MEIMKNDDNADDGTINLPFPHRLLSLYRQFEEATDQEDRYMLAREIAEVFSEDHDPTDYELNDSYHEYFEEFDKAKLAYDQAALKVARVATQVVKHHLLANEMTAEDILGSVPDRNSN